MDFRMQKPRGVEFNNLLVGGASESRPDRVRYEKVLRGVEPGKMTWFWLSPPNTPGGSLAGNGFIAFVHDAEMNPCVALDEVNPHPREINLRVLRLISLKKLSLP